MDKQKSKLERKQKRFIKLLSKEKERRPEEIASTIDFDDPDVKKVVNEIFEDKQDLENQWEPFNSEVNMYYFGLLAGTGVASFACWCLFGKGIETGNVTKSIIGAVAGTVIPTPGLICFLKDRSIKFKEKKLLSSIAFDRLVEEVELIKQKKAEKSEGRNL